jgi:hypothetical protein
LIVYLDDFVCLDDDHEIEASTKRHKPTIGPIQPIDQMQPQQSSSPPIPSAPVSSLTQTSETAHQHINLFEDIEQTFHNISNYKIQQETKKQEELAHIKRACPNLLFSSSDRLEDGSKPWYTNAKEKIEQIEKIKADKKSATELLKQRIATCSAKALGYNGAGAGTGIIRTGGHIIESIDPLSYMHEMLKYDKKTDVHSARHVPPINTVPVVTSFPSFSSFPSTSTSLSTHRVSRWDSSYKSDSTSLPAPSNSCTTSNINSSSAHDARAVSSSSRSRSRSRSYSPRRSKKHKKHSKHKHASKSEKSKSKKSKHKSEHCSSPRSSRSAHAPSCDSNNTISLLRAERLQRETQERQKSTNVTNPNSSNSSNQTHSTSRYNNAYGFTKRNID